MRLTLFFLLFIPITAFASVGDDLNNLIDRFFGEGQEPLQENINESFPPIEIPDFSSVETLDLGAVQESIFLEEENLDYFESKIQEKGLALAKVKADTNSVGNQLFLLDSQIGLNTQKYNQYFELEGKWKTELEKLTHEKSQTRALLRSVKRDYERFMSKNFVRKENLQSDPEVSVLQWLFSSRPVSKILEDRRFASIEGEQKAGRLRQIESVKIALDKQEKKTAMLYDRMSYLGRQVAREKMILSDMADLKAKILTRNETDQEALQAALSTAQAAQIKSTVYLQALHQQLLEVQVESNASIQTENVDDVLDGQEDLSLFDWPLAIPIKIEAQFRDPQYKKEFAREHDGIDIEASQGTSVIAPADGAVKKVISNGYGYAYIILEHDNDLFTVYGHLSKMFVNKGDTVSYGQEIALTGGTPGTNGAGFFTSGPHLHFEIFHNGHHVDPLKFLPKTIN